MMTTMIIIWMIDYDYVNDICNMYVHCMYLDLTLSVITCYMFYLFCNTCMYVLFIIFFIYILC